MSDMQRVNQNNNIYVQGVGTLGGTRIDGFLIAISQINNQSSPEDPKIIDIVAANTTSAVNQFRYNVILYNKLNPRERYSLSYTEEAPIYINPHRTHKIILEFPIGKYVANDQWGLLIQDYNRIINLPLRVNLVA